MAPKESGIVRESIPKLVAWARTQNLDYSVTPEEFGYPNPVLVLMDAVLSINRKYDAFVVPRIRGFSEQYPEVTTLRRLKILIDAHGHRSFDVVWNYNHPDRVRILDELTCHFLELQRAQGIDGEMETMQSWARTGNNLPVSGIGFRTTQYLRMMLGTSTVKPDVHIQRAVRDAVGRSLPDRTIVQVVEAAARRLKVEATSLDHAIWKRYAREGPRVNEM